jgi:drug/metabolite transporter (DMT)-like permease
MAFAAVSTLWGMPYLFIKIAVDDGVSPGFLAWARVVLGSAVLLALAWRAGALGSLRGHWRWLAVYGLVEITIPFPLIAIGEQRVSSSLAAILIATVPLLIAVLAIRFDHSERVGGSRLVGLFVGLAGVVALVGIDVAGSTDELVGAGAILLAAFGYACGPMILKRRRLTEWTPGPPWASASPSRRCSSRLPPRRRPQRPCPRWRPWSPWPCWECSAPRRRSCSSACSSPTSAPAARR